jgi:ankyrin repeat protein
VKAIKKILARNPDAMTYSLDGITTPLNCAIEFYENEDSVIDLLLATKTVDVNLRTGNHGWTPLYEAARGGDLRVAEKLLRDGADMEIACNLGWTPLMQAARSGYWFMANYLILSGANIEAASKIKMTALMIAAQAGKTAMVQLLLKHGAKVNACDDDDWTALDFAQYAQDGPHQDIVELLQALS